MFPNYQRPPAYGGGYRPQGVPAWLGGATGKRTPQTYSPSTPPGPRRNEQILEPNRPMQWWERFLQAPQGGVTAVQGRPPGLQGLPPAPAWLRPQQNKQKHQAGYWQTGENERLTISQGGNTIRLGPNSYMEPNRPMQWWERFLQAPQGGGGVTGVRG
jgi:hypothetical protein